MLSDEERAEVKQLANTCHKAAHLLCVTRGRTLTTIEATRSVVSGAMVC